MTHLISKLCDILVRIILVAVLLVAAVLLVPKLMGYQIYGVLSGSMEPAYHVGSVIYVKPTAAEQIAPGDTITFTVMDGPEQKLVTHRVVEVQPEQHQFITKGDANQTIDFAPVAFENLVGKAVYTIPFLGFATFYLQSRRGMLAALILLLIVILLSLLSSLTDPRKKAQAAEIAKAAEPSRDKPLTQPPSEEEEQGQI